MGKTAIIVIRLIEESVEKENEMIEKEIFEEFSKGIPKIPCFQKVETVVVIDG